MPIVIGPRHFSGGSQLYRVDQNGLTPALRGLAQGLARISASAVSALTDNSGGATADGTIDAMTAFTLAALGSTDCAQKAELEASFANLTDGLKELIAQANAIHAKVPAMDGVLTDSIVGTAADGTIGAVDVSMTAVATSLASAVGANAFNTNYKNAISQLVYHVNKLCVACGVTALVDGGGGTVSFGTTIADIPEGTGTAVSGADATAANAGIKKTDCDAKLVLMTNALKEIATKLNACRSTTGGTAVVVAG
jgi:hypothetical protein